MAERRQVRPHIKAKFARVARRISAQQGSPELTTALESLARVDRKKEPKAKRVAKPGRGAAKGAAFERLMAKTFSRWVSAGASEDLLWRSAGSGGRSTQRRKQTGKGIEYHASDIAPLHPDAAPFVDVFTLECKNYASIDLQQLFYSPGESTIARWWAQAQRDAASVDRVPLLVVKELRRPELMVLPMSNTGRVASLLTFLHKDKSRPGPVFIPALDGYVVPLESVLAIKFTAFRECYEQPRHVRKPLPSRADDGSTPDRRTRRRVPLVGV